MPPQFDVIVQPHTDESDPDVAYNHAEDAFLIVWSSHTGDIVGQVYKSDGSLVHEYLRLLGSDHAEFTYSSPRVTFESTEKLYVVASIFVNLAGPLPDQALVLAAFNATGELVWETIVRSAPFSFSSRNPDLAAVPSSNEGSILVVWEESFGSILGQLLSTDGTLRGSPITIVHGTGRRYPPHAFNPAVVGQRSPEGSFFVVYQIRTSADSYVAGRVVDPFSGSIGGEVRIADMTELPRTSRGLRFEAGISVDYNEASETYLAAWYDDGAVYARRLNSSPATVGGVISLMTPFLWLTFVQGETPTVAASSVADQFFVTAATSRFGLFSWTSRFALAGRFVNPGGIIRETVSRWRSLPIRRSASNFAASNRRFLVVWEEAEASPLNHDLQGELVTLP